MQSDSAGWEGNLPLHFRRPFRVWSNQVSHRRLILRGGTVWVASWRLHLRAAALSLRDSAELIRRVMEERYGDHLA